MIVSYFASLQAAHRCREKRIAAMDRARAARAYFDALDATHTRPLVIGWVRIARMESRCARAHFARARAAQLSLLGECIDDARTLSDRLTTPGADTHRAG